MGGGDAGGVGIGGGGLDVGGTLSTGSASLDAADRADERLRREGSELLEAEAPAK